jgi:precorrin-3B C17-methyltransferase
VIQTRVEAAAKADFVIVLYNPKSKKRTWQLDRAIEMINKHRNGKTPVGVVRNATREGQAVRITTLSHLDKSKVDMLSILLVGNSQTQIMGEKMVTPRGYNIKV